MTAPGLILDLSALQGEHAPERGIARYVLETTRALLRQGAPIVRLGFNTARPMPDHVPDDLLSTGLVGWLTQRDVEAFRRRQPIVLHVFSPFELVTPFDGMYPPAASAPGAATTATAYDAIPDLDRERYLGGRLARSRYDTAARFLATVSGVFAISRHTAGEVTEHFGVEPGRVHYAGGGCGHFFQPVPHTGDQRPILQRTAPEVGPTFLLTVGGEEPRKNIDALVDAMALLPRGLRGGMQLVQVGAVSTATVQRWRDRSIARGLPADTVVSLGRVDDLTLRALYQECAVFVFPSLEEGFGLPVLEAAKCGSVVITSNRTSVPEILDDPRTAFDPTSATAIAHAIERALTDEDLRAGAIAAGSRAAAIHTWDAVAQRMITVWSAMGIAHSPQPERARIALVGRFGNGPAADGAVPRSNLALAEALSTDVAVTCFDTRPTHPAASGSMDVLPATALGTLTSAHAYDHVIHLLDPRPGPLALDLLLSVPDIVVAPATGSVRGYPAWATSPERSTWLRAEFDGVEGARTPPALRSGTGDARDGRPFGSRPFLHGAGRVIASSARDASLLRMDLGPGAVPTPVMVVGPSCDRTAGFVVRDTIVVVGCSDGWQWALDHVAARTGMEVVVLDLVDDQSGEADRRWMERAPRAAVLVALDHDAPVDHLALAMEAIAVGVPVVTTGSWASALPLGVVRSIDPACPQSTMAAHIAGLADESPLRRAQLAAAEQFIASRPVRRRALELIAAIDGNALPEAEHVRRRSFATFATTSAICRSADFATPEFASWCEWLGEPNGPRRKLWEYVAIARVFELAGVLAPGSRGLGFGVGTEPLTAAFAARGCCVTATDLDAERPEAADWRPSGQLATRVADLNGRGLCPPEVFAAAVEFRAVDMTAIPPSLRDYDFCWSSCAFEHLGSIDAGLRFVERSLETLRPGGIAVHTTEFLLSSDSHTLASGATVLFRADDLRNLVTRLEADGHWVAPLDFELGDELLDHHVDTPPFSTEPHLKLELGGHVTTSAALIVRRATNGPTSPPPSRPTTPAR